MLDSLTREGKVIAAFASAHESFHRYHDDAIRVAPSAMSDSEALDQLHRILGNYLNLFHEHHSAEEVYLFPTLCRVQPALDPDVQQLRNQHAQLTKHTNSVRQHVDQLDAANAGAEIPALVQKLISLHELVVEHLALEEAVTVPVIRTWTRWPV